MRSSTGFALSLLALGVVAAPAPSSTEYPHAGKAYPYGTCMTRADALKVANTFEILQDQAFNVTLARAAVSPEFIDYNDSINT